MTDHGVTVSEVGHNASAPDRFLMFRGSRIALLKTLRKGQGYAYEIYALDGGPALARSTNFAEAVDAGAALMCDGTLTPESLPEAPQSLWQRALAWLKWGALS